MPQSPALPPGTTQRTLSIIMDREDQKDLLNSVVASAGIDPKEIRFPKGDVLADIFSFAVNTERAIEELLAEKFPYFLPLLEQIKDVHARYERRKKSTNSLDFDDLLEKTLRMLKEHARACPNELLRQLNLIRILMLQG